MDSNLTAIVVLTSVIHVAALVLMIWIRVRRNAGEGMTAATGKITPCVVCGERATTLGYDGLDPDEQHDPHTGRAWSADSSHYRPVCPAHEDHGAQEPLAPAEPAEPRVAALRERGLAGLAAAVQHVLD